MEALLAFVFVVAIILEVMKVFGEQCFNAARKTWVDELQLPYEKESYSSFQDYLKSLEK